MVGEYRAGLADAKALLEPQWSGSRRRKREAGQKYEFKFIAMDEFHENPEKWFNVGRILDILQANGFTQMLIGDGHQDNKFAAMALSKRHAVVHTERIIN
jgi:hypothetical protein